MDTIKLFRRLVLKLLSLTLELYDSVGSTTYFLNFSDFVSKKAGTDRFTSRS